MCTPDRRPLVRSISAPEVPDKRSISSCFVVVRDLGDAGFELSSVIAAGNGVGDPSSLLVGHGLGLGRLEDPVR
jgi:hypothetical protein